MIKQYYLSVYLSSVAFEYGLWRRSGVVFELSRVARPQAVARRLERRVRPHVTVLSPASACSENRSGRPLALLMRSTPDSVTDPVGMRLGLFISVKSEPGGEEAL